ncbi:MAG: hypothetical protein QXH56_08200 [Thermoprotei archaeon]
MSSALKKRFLELLEKDEEFRVMVAAKLGLSSILETLNAVLSTLQRLTEEVKSLREGQEKLWDNVNKLWLEVKSLREGQEKLWDNVNKLWLEVKSLREGQEKLWLEVKSLREGQEKLWLEVKSLREGQEKLWREQVKMSESMRDISSTLQRLTLSEEEEASEVVSYRLREKLGLELVLSRVFVDSKEVDLYASTDDVWVVGEATTRLGVRLILEVDEKVDLIRRLRPDLVRPKLIKVVYTIVPLGDAIQEAKRRGVWVLTWKEELSPLVVHTVS